MRLSSIGDVIHGVPVLCALREAMPKSYISWIVEGAMGDVLDGHPALDELIRVPRRFWRSPLQLWRLRQQLRARQFDVAIDLQSLTKSAATAWLSGACRRIGKRGQHAKELSGWINNELVETGAAHVVDHYLTMLQSLAIESPEVRFDLKQSAADGEAVKVFLQQCGLSGRRFAVLNVGAGWVSKVWPAVRYAALARYLGQTHAMPSVITWGTAKEKLLAERVIEAGARHAHLAAPFTMRELGALCRRAALFVGSDTGPTHLAAAVETPTVSLHGPTPADWCGAYGSHCARVQVRYQVGSSSQRRRQDGSAMQEISTRMVAAACDELLSRTASRKCG